MEFVVTGRNMMLTPDLKGHAETKLADAVGRIIGGNAAKMTIELRDLGSNIRENQECKITVKIPQGRTIAITQTGTDMAAVIDLAHDRVVYQVKRERNRKRKGAANRKQAMRVRHKVAKRALSSSREDRQDYPEFDKAG